jgi:hypothetical protein
MSRAACSALAISPERTNRRWFLDSIGGQFAILSVPQLSLTMRLLNEDSDAEFLANPRVVTANNMKADIKITRAQPVPQLNFNEQTAQAVFSGFQTRNSATRSRFCHPSTRTTSSRSWVKPEISNKVGDAAFTFGAQRCSVRSSTSAR